MTALPNVSRLCELMIVGPITVHSARSHHLCPILGKVWIGMLPDAGSDQPKYATLQRATCQRRLKSDLNRPGIPGDSKL